MADEEGPLDGAAVRVDQVLAEDLLVDPVVGVRNIAVIVNSCKIISFHIFVRPSQYNLNGVELRQAIGDDDGGGVDAVPDVVNVYGAVERECHHLRNLSDFHVACRMKER